MKQIAVVCTGNTIAWGGWRFNREDLLEYFKGKDNVCVDSISMVGTEEDWTSDEFNAAKVYTTSNIRTLVADTEYHFIQPGCSMHTRAIYEDYDEVEYYQCPTHRLIVWPHEYSMSIWDLQEAIQNHDPDVVWEFQGYTWDYRKLSVICKGLGIDLDKLQEELNQKAIKSGKAIRTQRTIDMGIHPKR